MTFNKYMRPYLSTYTSSYVSTYTKAHPLCNSWSLDFPRVRFSHKERKWTETKKNVYNVDAGVYVNKVKIYYLSLFSFFLSGLQRIIFLTEKRGKKFAISVKQEEEETNEEHKIPQFFSLTGCSHTAMAITISSKKGIVVITIFFLTQQSITIL